MKTMPDMSKVRAFLRQKEAKESQQTFPDPITGGTVTISVAGMAPVSKTAPGRDERIRELTANALQWHVITYESIGNVLGLELNPAMPPMAIHNAINARLQEMTEADRAAIPEHVNTCINNLHQVVYGNHSIPTLNVKPSKSRQKLLPIRVSHDGGDIVSIFPVGCGSETWIHLLDANPKWTLWRKVNGSHAYPGTKENGKNGWVIFQCAAMARWSEIELKQIFAGFDDPMEGELIS